MGLATISSEHFCFYNRVRNQCRAKKMDTMGCTIIQMGLARR